jgi:sugar diacid utilization regulator
MSELQRLTDQLGERLSRSVAIDDPRMRLQSYSPHYGAVDEQRIASILHRQANAEAIEWAFEHGVQKATGWVRVPANPERGMLSRVCVPIRFGDVHLGYLWLIDHDESMTPEELALADDAADRAAAIMYRESLVTDLQRSRERELLRDLLDDDPAVREQAINGLAEEALFELDRPVVALVLDIHDPPGVADRAQAADLALATARRLVPIRRSLYLVRPEHAILVVAVDRDTHTEEIAARMKTAYEGALDSQVGIRGVRVGTGTSVPNARDMYLTYRQARTAARVARVLGLGAVVPWDDLGVYRLLAELPPEQVNDESLHPALAKLDAHDDGAQLLQTLETYLDNAGDVRLTADQLFLHRSTLYHRLSRIEELGVVNLKSGSDRLDLHLSLKLAHLAGRLTASAIPGPG